MAEYYSKELSRKVSDTMISLAKNQQKALGGPTPFGLLVEDGKYAPNPKTSPYVKKVFEMYAQDIPIIRICDYLNENGLRTNKGNLFEKSSLHRILKNEKL